MYQDALQKSSFTERIKYIASDNIRESNTEEKKRRKRKISGSIRRIQWM